MMSDEIIKLLEDREMTQKQLAQKLGISEPTLSKKLTYDNWRENDLYKIAEACDCRYEGRFIYD